MEKNELDVLIDLRRLASKVLSDPDTAIDINVDDIEYKATGQQAQDIAKGIMLAVQAMELSRKGYFVVHS